MLRRALGSARNVALPLWTQQRWSSRRRYKHKVSMVADDAENPLSKPAHIDPSVLHIVSVPIGNVKDFSLRSLEVLRKVDVIVCANRLATKVFLELIDIDPSGRLIQYRPKQGNTKLVELLKSGSSMAFVATNGTPVVGDTGSDFVREMVASGIRVSAVPGPSSIVAALTMSGVSMGNGCFFFGNWLSMEGKERLRQLSACKEANYPSVYYEAPERLLQSLADIASVLPNRRVSVVHEMTKVFEAVHSDTAKNLAYFYAKGSMARYLAKGQLTLVIEGSEVEALTSCSIPQKDLALAVKTEVDRGHSVEAAVHLVARSLDVAKRHVQTAVKKLDLHQTTSAPEDVKKTIETTAEKVVRKKKRRILKRKRTLKMIEKKMEQLKLLKMMGPGGG